MASTICGATHFYGFVFKSDVKSYYASINHDILIEQLRDRIDDPQLLDLVCQYVRRTVVKDGIHTDVQRGIPLGCSLSPLMAAVYLKPLDEAMEKTGLFYARFMDDWVVLAPTRWKLRKVVRITNRVLNRLRVDKHPDKTFVGRVAGAVPFGYTADTVSKQLIPDRCEARRVKAMFERAAKGETPRQIAAHANRRGWRTKSVRSRATGRETGGQRWTARQILSLLSTPTYLGLIHDRKTTLKGIHQPIVTPELFQQAAQQVSERRTQVKPRRREPAFPWPLGGLLFCGQCGRLMSPSISNYKNLQYRYYRCRSQAGGRKPCHGVSIPAEEIEQFVCDQLASIKLDGDIADSNDTTQINRDFVTIWAGIPFDRQRKLMPEILDNVVFHPGKGTLRIKIQAGAAEWLIANHQDS